MESFDIVVIKSGLYFVGILFLVQRFMELNEEKFYDDIAEIRLSLSSLDEYERLLSAARGKDTGKELSLRFRAITDHLTTRVRSAEKHAKRLFFLYPYYRLFIHPLFEEAIEAYDDITFFAEALAAADEPSESVAVEEASRRI